MEEILKIMKLSDQEWASIAEVLVGVFLLISTSLLLFSLVLSFSPDEEKIRRYSWFRRFFHYFYQMQKKGIFYYLLFLLICFFAFSIRANLI